jgi:hypothetical protein
MAQHQEINRSKFEVASFFNLFFSLRGKGKNNKQIKKISQN